MVFSEKTFVHIRGFIERVALEFPPVPPPPATILPPSPEILKLNMVTIVFSQALNSNLVPGCVRSNLNLNSKFFCGEWGGGTCPQTPLVGTHATIILLPSCFSPTPQLKILYETLHMWDHTFSLSPLHPTGYQRWPGTVSSQATWRAIREMWQTVCH